MLKPINAHKSARDLRPGDLWVHPVPEAYYAVVLVQAVEPVTDHAGNETLHITYACNWQWANDASFTEALGRHSSVQVLLLEAEDDLEHIRAKEAS